MDLFIEKFISSRTKKTGSKPTRQTMGNFATIVGLSINIILFLVKLAVAAFTKSIAVAADAINNLSDCFSGILSLVSFKLSAMPPDEEHPFGHARVEYIFSSITAMIILYIAITLFKESVNKILNPVITQFSILTGVLLALSMLAKFVQGEFYKNMGNRINSQLLITNSIDSKSDVMSTCVVLISLAASRFTTLPLDGIMGVGVSILVFKSAVGILKETASRLIGEGPNYQDQKMIIDFVEGYDGIEGTHDLIIHDYGPGHVFASIHAEVDAKIDVIESHAIVDKIEDDAISKMGLQLIIHMDPLVLDDPRLESFKEDVDKVLKNIDKTLSFHDLRVVDNFENLNLLFDVDVTEESKISDKELTKEVVERLKKINPRYNPIITIDRNYFRRLTDTEIK